MNEINDLKAGSYTVLNMLFYILLLMPSYLYTVIPLSILIGISIAIFGLVKSSEYVIIINAGLPKRFILQQILLLTSIIAIIVFIIGNYIIPSSETAANSYKAHHIMHNSSLHYLWLKENENRIFRIEQLNVTTNDSGTDIISFKNIAMFEYNHKDLLTYITAESGFYVKNQFILNNANSYDYQHHNLNPKHVDKLNLTTTMSDKYLLSIEQPQEMSVSQLINFINYLKHSKQNSTKQEISLYSKMIYPIFCIIMGFVALLFVPYHIRQSTGAISMMINIVLGIFIFFVNKFAQYIAVYFHLPATSSVVLLIVTMIFMGLAMLKA